MDLQNFSELYCAVCFELFGDGTKCPRMLSCGHTFCYNCLDSLLVQSPVCPSCKKVIQFSSTDEIPVNYFAKSIISHLTKNIPDVPTEANMEDIELKVEDSANISVMEKESVTKGLPSEGYCEEHESYKHLRCMDCESWNCGVCATLHHKSCRTILVAEALKEMKQKISRDVDDEIEVQNFQYKSLDIFLENLEEKQIFLKKKIKNIQLHLRNKIETLKTLGEAIEKLQSLKSERKLRCRNLKVLETSVGDSVNNDQFTNATNKFYEFLTEVRKLVGDLTVPRNFCSPLLLEVLRKWCQNGPVYASHYQNGTSHYGKVDLIEDRVWVYRFQPKIPKLNSVIISFKELVMNFNGSSKLPRRGFLQVEDRVSKLVNIVIVTDSLTPRALNFLLLCAGLKGRSYVGYTLTANSGWLYGKGNGEAVIKGIRNGLIYEAPAEQGCVCGSIAEPTVSSLFFIQMLDRPNKKSNAKFGIVEEGFDICIDICKFNKTSSILNCGLVI